MTTFGEAVTQHRKQLGWTQAELARRIPLDAGHLSKVLSGQRDLTGDTAAQIDRALNADGLLAALAPRPAEPAPDWMGDVLMDDEPPLADARVQRDQQEWVRTRAVLRTHRHALAHTAAQIYDPAARLGDTGVLAAPGWIPDRPVDLDDIALEHRTSPDPPLTGGEPESAGVRPRRSVVGMYAHYTEAVEALDRPRLFQNRHSWRLTDLAWDGGKGRMGWADSCYFAGVDVFEAAAHELAAVALDDNGHRLPAVPTLRDLPFRRLVGDPFDLARRPVVSAISTLTIRHDSGGAEFLLHRRDGSAVAMAGGMLQVIPSGIFQPSSVFPAAQVADFGLWRNIQREFSEELLGNPEHSGDRQSVDYSADPFAALDAARAAGRLSVHCLGVGLDALTLFGEILTVLVMDAPVFDRLARDFVARNNEGTVAQSRVPFTDEGVRAVLGSGRMAPAGAACLELALRHRDVLLG